MDKLPRKCTPDAALALKSATRHSLKIASAARFALATHVGTTALSDYGNAAEKDFMPVDVLFDLQGEFPDGVPSPLLQELAALAGFKLVPLDDGNAVEPLSIDDVGAMMREGGESEASALRAATAPTCLASIRAATKELSEDVSLKVVAIRKLARQESRIMARAVAS